ncbi:hypothetical protein EV363DRAFT_1592967 [Boletus edulis]|nr:hypothetical protein EV363DRAFT_1592967 [Boletus edulis]
MTMTQDHHHRCTLDDDAAIPSPPPVTTRATETTRWRRRATTASTTTMTRDHHHHHCTLDDDDGAVPSPPPVTTRATETTGTTTPRHHHHPHRVNDDDDAGPPPPPLHPRRRRHRSITTTTTRATETTATPRHHHHHHRVNDDDDGTLAPPVPPKQRRRAFVLPRLAPSPSFPPCWLFAYKRERECLDAFAFVLYASSHPLAPSAGTNPRAKPAGFVPVPVTGTGTGPNSWTRDQTRTCRAGTGFQRVRVRVWVRTPAGLPVPFPTATLTGRKRATTIQAADHREAPLSKRPCTKPSSVQDKTGVECTTRKVKYNNTHLPRGAMIDNKWRGILIPTYAKWSGMLNVCWGTKSSSEVEVLQLLWNVIYKDKIPATVQSDESIHTVATQRIAEWRGGFASASIAMIHSLINSNEAFNSPERQCELANFWLEGNRFLFEDVTGDSSKDYKGMWKSRFVLQTFAAHMHFIQGAMDIPIETGLKGGRGYPKAALSLAGVAVKRTFVLLRDKALTFEIIPPTGKGKRKVTGSEKWKANISGEMFKKDFWGHETARYMQSVEKIPPKVWDDIIKTSLQLVKDTLRKPGRGTLSDDEDDDPKVSSDNEDDELNDLMTYR